MEIFSFRITSFHGTLILVIEVSKKKQTEGKEMIIENQKKNCVKQHQTTTISYRGRIVSLKNHKPKKH